MLVTVFNAANKAHIFTEQQNLRSHNISVSIYHSAIAAATAVHSCSLRFPELLKIWLCIPVPKINTLGFRGGFVQAECPSCYPADSIKIVNVQQFSCFCSL